jgi:ABC transporter substrate binding protein (PQQ-dependent alcohol dehydrogenase system)
MRKRVRVSADLYTAAALPGRRRFLLGGLSAALVAARPARADLRVGLVNPPGPLAASILRGAQMGAAEAESLAQMFDKKVELLTPKVAGTAGVAAAAASLVKDGVAVLVGGGDQAAAEALRDAARNGKALFLNVGCAADRLRSERCDRHAFHLHASVQMHAGAAAFWLAEEKKLRRWAVVGADELRRTVAAFASARGATVAEDLAVAHGTPDWGPTIERLRAAQAEAVWLGVPASQVDAFLPRYAQAGVGGELIVLDPDAGPLREAAGASGVRPLMWHHTLEKYSARELNNRHRRRFAEPLDGASWSAWAALKLVGEAMLRQGTTPRAIVEYLESDPPFDGHKGRALTFRKSDHQLRQPLYLWRSGKAGGAAAGEVVAEVPRGGDLDAIFLPVSDGGCLGPGGAQPGEGPSA